MAMELRARLGDAVEQLRLEHEGIRVRENPQENLGCERSLRRRHAAVNGADGSPQGPLSF